MRDPKLSPLDLRNSILLLIIPAVLLYLTHYYLVPGYAEWTGVPYFKGYLAGYVTTMGLFFVAVLGAYRLEGRAFAWIDLKSRFRLGRMEKADWIWTAAMIIFVLITYFGLDFTGDWVWSVPFLAPREAWPPEFGPGGTRNYTPGEFMEMPLRGEWWVVIVFFMGWFFNIAGEELWFRGYILPRQELAFGRSAWLINGLMFTFTHIWQPWVLIAMSPTALLLAYIVQKRKNTWIGIVQHGLLNFSLLIILVAGVIG